MRRSLLMLVLLASAIPALTQSITISFPTSKSAKPLDGRLLLLLSNDTGPDGKAEPRNQINDTPRTQIVFGTTVAVVGPGRVRLFGGQPAGAGS